MENLVYQYAKDHELVAGICDAKRLVPPVDIGKIATPFTESNKEMRLDPLRIMPSAKSIIVIGMGYNKKDNFRHDNEIRGIISKGAIGLDYHKRLKEHLLAIGNLIENAGGSYEIFVDTGPLIERELAKKAGIGFQGKNCLIINEKLGSFFYIGHMLTDIGLKFSKPVNTEDILCNTCDRCIKACPGKALSEGYKFSYETCVSYLTQKKEKLTEKEMEIMGRSIYGCDICQNVCPYNKGKYAEEIKDIDLRFPRIENFIGLNNKEFKETYGNTSAFWRGRSILTRNALIAAGNSGDEKALEFLENMLKSPSENARYAAQYSVNKLKLKYLPLNNCK